MNDMRKLLSSAFPDPEDEPHQRDVIGAAMEWGDRRRRRDWMLTGVAAVAVLVVGAGVAVLGTGSGSGRDTAAASGGLDPLKSPGSPFDPAVTDGRPLPGALPTCTPAVHSPPDDKNKSCAAWIEQNDWATDFVKGSVPYIRASLPPGFTVKASDSYVVELTGPDGKTNILFPSVTSVYNVPAPGCGGQTGNNCTQTSIGGGKAVVGQYPSAGQSAAWVADGQKDPVILMGVNTVGTPGIGGLPAPTGGPLLSAADLARIIGNPDYVQYAKQQWQRQVDRNSQLGKQHGPTASGSESGSAPWTPSSSAQGTPSSSASGTPSGSAPWTPSSSASGTPSSSSPGWPPSSSSGSPVSWPSSSATGWPGGPGTSPGWPSGTPASSSHS